MFSKVTFARSATYSTAHTPNAVSRSIRRFKNIITGRFARSSSADVKHPSVQKTACELQTATCELQTRLGMLAEQISFEVENRADLKDWYESMCRQNRSDKERLDISKVLFNDCCDKRNLALKNLEKVRKEEQLIQEALKKTKNDCIGNLYSSSTTSVSSSSTSVASSSVDAKSNASAKTGSSTDTKNGSTTSAKSSSATLKSSL
ncbi:hypothetical protein GGI07_004433 [Coemansia sp. Benny D115]|nr:hypothetical protein GGI07_004433 [Coemansia sp. Benny D115]